MPRQPITYFSHILGRFDKDAGVIRGVSVITECEAKGHGLKVDGTTLNQIKDCAEQFDDGRLKTKLNHRSGIDAVFGYLSDFRVDGPKLVADLHMLKSHNSFEQTWEQLETLPNSIGLSVAFAPGREEKDSRTGMKLARCSEILSADLVPEPAANPTGLFEAKVDNTNYFNMDIDNNDTTQNDGSQGAVSNEDLMAFLQNQLLPRLEQVEQFQAAIQAELENADGEKAEDDLAEGDLGNESAFRGGNGDQGDGGTRVNGGHRAGEQNQQMQPAMAAEFAELRKGIVLLQRRFEQADQAAEQEAFDADVNVLATKIDALTEFASKAELENQTLRAALKTGGNPVKHTTFFEKRTDQGAFESLVQETTGKVNPKTNKNYSKAEATLFAAKANPAAHREYLERGGMKFVETL